MREPNKTETYSLPNKKPLGIRGRLVLGFTAVTFVFFIVVLITLYLLWNVKNEANNFLNYSLTINHDIEDLQARASILEIDVWHTIISRDANKRQSLNSTISAINELLHQIDKKIPILNDDQVNEKWSTLSKTLQLYQSTLTDILKLFDTGAQNDAIKLYHNKLIPLTAILNSNFNVELSADPNNKGVEDVMDEILRSHMKVIIKQVNILGLVSITFMVLSILLAYFIALFTSKSILNPIRHAIYIAKQLASGKRDIDIVVNRDDETGQLLTALAKMSEAIKASEEKIQHAAVANKRLYDSLVKSANLFSNHTSRVAAGDLTKRLDIEKEGLDQEIMNNLGTDLNLMTDKLSSITKNIIETCGNMVSTLEEVRHAVDAQSAGANVQASSINEITTSITEIEKSASQTMNKAKELRDVTSRTYQSGQLGLKSVDASVLRMKTVKERAQAIAQTIANLSSQTQQIGEITNVVTNLAQQSKMLGLNASIEAAKAGDAGKGFAVVAAEVKNLAEQSEQSTHQVQKMLEDIKVTTEKAVMVTEAGVRVVDNALQMIEQTGEVIRDLNAIINEVTISSKQIEDAVRQESAGIEQITAGMNQINAVTYSFVESAKQTTAAMEDLSKITSKLKSTVDAYKV